MTIKDKHLAIRGHRVALLLELHLLHGAVTSVSGCTDLPCSTGGALQQSSGSAAAVQWQRSGSTTPLSLEDT